MEPLRDDVAREKCDDLYSSKIRDLSKLQGKAALLVNLNLRLTILITFDVITKKKSFFGVLDFGRLEKRIETKD